MMRSEYVITMPNMYARGILFGKMVIELGDACTAHNDSQDLHADLEFKTKGFFSGTYNAIAGRVRHGPTDLGEVSGRWSALMEFKSTKVGTSPFFHQTQPHKLLENRQERSARCLTCRKTVAL